MVPTRAFAILTLLLVAAYIGLRAFASGCQGLQCEVMLGPSLFLPAIILYVAALSGVVAVLTAWRGRHAAWVGVLSVCTIVGVVGPLACASLLRDSPDGFVLISTLLVVLVPVAALLYTFIAPSAARPSPG